MMYYDNAMRAIQNLSVPCQFAPGQYATYDNIVIRILHVGFNKLGQLVAECVSPDYPTALPYRLSCSNLKPIRRQPHEVKASLRVYRGGKQ